ncbi:MAG: DUF2268 domain-containing putative Zn-dependent protease [Pseudoxanthomonas sp.]
MRMHPSWIKRGPLVMAFALLIVPAITQDARAANGTAATQAIVRTGDVDLFYRVYDYASGRPTAEQLQHEYLDQGSEGLRLFARLRNISGQRIADAMAADPSLYSGAKRCLAVLPRARARLDDALHTLGRLYAEARFPPVTIAIGRGKPVAIGAPDTGIPVGLEALCATDWLNPDVEDRIVYVLAHEYVHVQQVRADPISRKDKPTVLEISLLEGIAEFVDELMTGHVAYSRNAATAAGREREIETRFAVDLDKTDLSDWAYNATPGTPGDLGYWVGYRIAKASYRNAPDKRQALREILEMDDAKAFLANSGWHPGIDLEPDEAPSDSSLPGSVSNQSKIPVRMSQRRMLPRHVVATPTEGNPP